MKAPNLNWGFGGFLFLFVLLLRSDRPSIVSEWQSPEPQFSTLSQSAIAIRQHKNAGVYCIGSHHCIIVILILRQYPNGIDPRDGHD